MNAEQFVQAVIDAVFNGPEFQHVTAAGSTKDAEVKPNLCYIVSATNPFDENRATNLMVDAAAEALRTELRMVKTTAIYVPEVGNRNCVDITGPRGVMVRYATRYNVSDDVTTLYIELMSDDNSGS